MVVSRYWIHKKGFTFIEIMVALAIVSTLLIVVIGSLNYHLGLLDKQKTSTIATILAKEKLRDIKKSLKEERGSFPEPNNSFTFDAQIKGSDYPNMLEITVRVANDREKVVISELVEKRQ